MANTSHQEIRDILDQRDVGLIAPLDFITSSYSAHNCQRSRYEDYGPVPPLMEESDNELVGLEDSAENGPTSRHEEPVYWPANRATSCNEAPAYSPEKSKAANRASKSFREGLRRTQKRLSSVLERAVCPNMPTL